MGCLTRTVRKARAKNTRSPANADLAGYGAAARPTVIAPEQPDCATLEQVVTIGTAAVATARPWEKTRECPLKPRQQERRAIRPRLAHPLQIVSPASEPIQGMEVARQHVIPSSRAVSTTACRDGTIG